MSAESSYIPTSLQAAVPKTRKADPTPGRVSFAPWGGTKLGDPDPETATYRMVEGEFTFHDETNDVAYFRGIDGREYILAPGSVFRPTTETETDVSLAKHGRVLGRKHPTDGGYYPVGVNPVVLTGESS